MSLKMVEVPGQRDREEEEGGSAKAVQGGDSKITKRVGKIQEQLRKNRAKSSSSHELMQGMKVNERNQVRRGSGVVTDFMSQSEPENVWFCNRRYSFLI